MRDLGPNRHPCTGYTQGIRRYLFDLLSLGRGSKCEVDFKWRALKPRAAGGTVQRNPGGSALKRSIAATVLFTFALGVETTYLIALTGGQTSVARVPMKEIAGEEVVQVSINGTGPYDFILDTGSNVTIMRSQLIRKLNLSSGAPMAIVTATGEIRGQRVIIESIAVAGLAVEHLEINALDRVQVLNGRVQGILGENFL